MWLFLAIPAAVFATDCNVVRMQLYGTEACEFEMKCSTGFACLVSENSCDYYECLTEDMGCPDGYTFSPFIAEIGDGSRRIESRSNRPSTTSTGLYCAPPGPTPQESFTCFFDQEDNFKLKVNVVVPEIWKDHNLDSDNRQITLISKDAHDLQAPAPAPYTVFGGSSCIGASDGENVYFNDIVEDTNCDFTLDMETDEAGTLWYTQSFSVGYDDLTDVDYPNLIFRYGRNWNMECRIKASDTLYVEPIADGERVEEDEIIDTEVQFAMGVYYDDAFTRPFLEPIDIGVESIQQQRVYIKAEAFTENDIDYMLHMKECKLSHYVNGIMVQDDAILVDGCLRGYDIDFVSRTFEQKSSRVEFADGNNEKTINNDQFSVDLWDVASGDTVTYRFTCHLVICEINAFQGVQDPTSVCNLNSQCQSPNRYSNLFTSFARAVKNEDKISRSRVFEVENTLEVHVVDGDAKPPPPPVDVVLPTDKPGSATSVMGCITMMLMMLFL